MSCIYAIKDEDGGILDLNCSWVTVPGEQESITQAKANIADETIYPMPTINGTINEEPLFSDNIAKQPPKIILVIGLILVLLIISIAIVRKCYQCYQCYHSLSIENQAKATVIKIGKSQHMF